MRTFLLLLLCSTVAQAFEFPSNPDRFQTNGGLVGFGGRYKVPVSGAVTIHSFAETAGINNNHQFTDGYKLGVGFQLYMK
jgi:hypothetical protein